MLGTFFGANQPPPNPTPSPAAATSLDYIFADQWSSNVSGIGTPANPQLTQLLSNAHQNRQAVAANEDNEKALDNLAQLGLIVEVHDGSANFLSAAPLAQYVARTTLNFSQLNGGQPCQEPIRVKMRADGQTFTIP
ncbi:hypothetical protein BGX28_008270, partial [Mortierella sp. GBA30]